MNKLKNLLLLLLVSSLAIFSSCSDDLQDEVDQLKKEKEELQKQLDLQNSSLSDLQAQLALLTEQKETLEGDNTELNALITQLQSMINNRYIERHIAYVFHSYDDLSASTWQHLYSEDLKLSMSIRNKTGIFDNGQYDIQRGNIDGFKTQKIIEHSYEDGLLAQSSFEDKTIDWIWEDGVLTSYVYKYGNKKSIFSISDDFLHLELKEYYTGDELISKVTYEYYDNGLIKTQTTKDASDVVKYSEHFEYNEATFLTSYTQESSGVVIRSVEWRYNEDLKLTYYNKKENDWEEVTINVTIHDDGSYTIAYYILRGTWSPQKADYTYSANGVLLEQVNYYYEYDYESDQYYVDQKNTETNTYDENGEISNKKTVVISYDKQGAITSRSATHYDDIVWAADGNNMLEYIESYYNSEVLQIRTEYKYVYKASEKYLDYVANWYIENGEAKYIVSTEKIDTYFDVAPFAPKTRTITQYQENGDSVVTKQENSVNSTKQWEWYWQDSVE